MKLIRPFVVTDASLVSCSVPETDRPDWSSGTVYNIGDIVQVKTVSMTVAISSATPCTVTAANHGFSDDQVVIFTAGTLPPQLSLNVPYYLRLSDTDTFRVSATKGGLTLSTTASASGITAIFPVHKQYECTATTTAGITPWDLLNAVYWDDSAEYLGYTNRWNQFDEGVGTQTSSTESMTTVVQTKGKIDAIALINVTATEVQVTSRDPNVSQTFAVTVSASGDAVVTRAAHDFDDGDIFKFSGSPLPTGITADTVYYVVNTLKKSVTFNSTSDIVLATSHGFTNGQTVTFRTTGQLPTGIVFATPYTIKNANTNDFQISSDGGATAVNFTTDGLGSHTVYGSTFSISLTLGGSPVTTSSSGTSVMAIKQLYNVTYNMNTPLSVSSWWDYFFEPYATRTDFVRDDLPLYESMEITVTLRSTFQVAIGATVLGLSKNLGTTQYGASVGIIDFGKKERDNWGSYRRVAGRNSKRARFSTIIDNSSIDGIISELTSALGIPSVYVGDSEMSSTIVYGFYKDFNIDIAYAMNSNCSIDIEGLT